MHIYIYKISTYMRVHGLPNVLIIKNKQTGGGARLGLSLNVKLSTTGSYLNTWSSAHGTVLEGWSMF